MLHFDCEFVGELLAVADIHEEKPFKLGVYCD